METMKKRISVLKVTRVVSRDATTGRFVVAKETKVLKKVVQSAQDKRKKTANWDAKSRAKLAKVRKKTSANYSQVFKTLAQY